MRAQGMLSGPAAAGSADHRCWVYDDVDSFAVVAWQYLAEGLSRGERLLCIGEPVLACLRQGAEPLFDIDGLIARGALEVLDLATAYDRAGAVRPEEQRAFYDAATRRAIDDGYRGLRVVADVTDLAADPVRRAELVRWEHLADDFIGTGSGMSALCAYEAARLDDDAVADLATVHPLVHSVAAPPPFRLWFDGDTVALAGCIDTFGADRLTRLLAGSPVREPVVALDLTRVEFMDAAGCRALALWAADLHERGVRPVLLGPSRLFRRVWQVLGFDAVSGAEIRDEAIPA